MQEAPPGVFQHHVVGRAYLEVPHAGARARLSAWGWIRRWLGGGVRDESPGRSERERGERPPDDLAQGPTHELTWASRVLETSTAGCVLEFAFRGVQDHTHGREMSRVITETIEARSPVAAIVINLLDYYYNAGDDIGGLYVAFADRKSR